MILGPTGFLNERTAIKQQSRSSAVKLREMIIGRIVNLKLAFQWVSRIDLTLHLSEHDSN